MKKLTLTIEGRPVTKKNHQQIIVRNGRPRIIQATSYYVYAASASKQLSLQYSGEPIGQPMAVQARYWLPNRRGKPDLNNLLSATADILQEAKIIQDDHLILSWNGSEIVGIDRICPRVEIEIQTSKNLAEKFQQIWQKEKP